METAADALEEAAKADGWSGVWDQKFEDAVVVWDPADLKAVDNRGTYDETDRIRYSTRDLTKSPAFKA